MKRVVSDDAEIVYKVLGDGPPVVLLHAFPANHELWLEAAQSLSFRYRLILPDLRGHGDSSVGQGPARMEKHAADIARVLDQERVGRSALAGASIGGYILFEFWRRYRDRVAGLVFCDTRAPADSWEARKARLDSATQVLEQGSERLIDSMIPRLFGKSTLARRPDLVASARKVMMKMSPLGISSVQKGMAERPDSVPTLKTIDVPTLIILGEEDVLATTADGDQMRHNIRGAQLKLISQAGHYAIFEQAQPVGLLIRRFLDSFYR